jgi:hypothetical protein
VETGTPRASARADCPPNLSMMVETVMPGIIAENAIPVNGRIADCFIYGTGALGHPPPMLRQAELLEKVRATGASNAEIATALKIHPSQVTRLFAAEGKPRKLALDEAAILVEAFELEQVPEVEPLPLSMLRLVVQFVAMELGVPARRVQEKQAELTEVLRAFSEFVADPKVRHSLDQAEGFFRAIALVRPQAESEAQPENDPERTR